MARVARGRGTRALGKPHHRFSFPAKWVATLPGAGVAMGKNASAVRVTRLSRSMPVKVPRAIDVRATSSEVGVSVP